MGDGRQAECDRFGKVAHACLAVLVCGHQGDQSETDRVGDRLQRHGECLGLGRAHHPANGMTAGHLSDDQLRDEVRARYAAAATSVLRCTGRLLSMAAPARLSSFACRSQVLGGASLVIAI